MKEDDFCRHQLLRSAQLLLCSRVERPGNSTNLTQLLRVNLCKTEHQNSFWLRAVRDRSSFFQRNSSGIRPIPSSRPRATNQVTSASSATVVWIVPVGAQNKPSPMASSQACGANSSRWKAHSNKPDTTKNEALIWANLLTLGTASEGIEHSTKDTATDESCKDMVLDKCTEVIDTLTHFITSTLEEAVADGKHNKQSLHQILTQTAAVTMRMKEHKRVLEKFVHARRRRIRRKTTHSHNTSGPCEEMDATIWSGLPEELLPKILARLPLSTFLQFRSVCRSWDALAQSQNFLAEVQPQRPWFLVYDMGDPSTEPVTPTSRLVASAYDFTQRKWRRLRLPQVTKHLRPLSSSGGLVCFGCTSYDEDNLPEWPLVVVNPITQECRHLPLMDEPDSWGGPWPAYSSVGIVVDPTSKQYKVVVVMKEPWNSSDFYGRIGGVVKIYDSFTDEWRTVSKRKMVDYVGSRDLVYCSGDKSIFDMKASALVNCYDITAMDETDIDIQTNVERCPFALLSEVSHDPIVENLAILKLEPPSETWEFFIDVPLELLYDFFGVEDLLEPLYTYIIHQSQDLLLLTVLQSRCADDYDRTRRRCTLLYDIARGEWSHQPVFNGADGWILKGEVEGVFFQPQLNAAV